MPSLYDSIGRGYDRRRQADPEIAATLARLLQPRSTGHYLDLACGTGNYTSLLADRGLRFTGIDPSMEMLRAARGKARSVAWVAGRAEHLPFADGTFDGAICTLAIHHFGDLSAALMEARRVLRRAGRLAIFTGEAGQMRHYWLNAYFPEAMARSIADMPDRRCIAAGLAAAGFSDTDMHPYFVTQALRDLFLYSGKHRPAFYLDSVIREGISTFSKHAPAAELAAVLLRLEEDIRSGHIDAVIREHASDGGDYLFVTARRSG